MQSQLPVPFCLYDFRDALGTSWRFAFAHPDRIISARCVSEVEPALLAVQEGVRQGFYASGFVAYEAAPAFDSALTTHAPSDLPLVWFGLFRNPLPDSVSSFATPQETSPELTWQPSISRAEYDRKIAFIRKAIGAGETYQVNFTLRLRTDFNGDTFSLYHKLRAAQRGADYCAYLDIGRYRILSASPELFFHARGTTLTTRPMKGTIRRGRWAGEDTTQMSKLQTSAKDRAENLMIVDLLRNDLGRIAEIGSVAVPRLFDVETYPTLLQMTSTVTASARPDVTLTDVFRGLFPCGSVTGAPKVSTMRLISALEEEPRGVYCGAIGLVKPNGEALFNVAIRTLVLDTTTRIAEYGVGGGITWDSTSQGEYDEMMLKAAVLTTPLPEFSLLETLLLKEGQFVLLERHLERLSTSAVYFDVDFAREEARNALIGFATTHAQEAWRVRLLVSQEGHISVEGQPLDALDAGRQPVVLSHGPVDRSDRFLYHKTTYRTAYNRFSGPRERGEVFDVLLWNELGELTEFTRGNLVMELDGQLWTPPRECGLLAGTLREELLAEKTIFARTIKRTELELASRLWFINSVRGWVEVSLRSAATGESAPNVAK